VFVADFSFMAERARIDDLALILPYTDTELGLAGTGDRGRGAAAASAGPHRHARRRRTGSAAVGYRPAAAVGHRQLGGVA
jgi:hypothetical protein